MSNKKSKSKDDNEVGYGRPPKKTRFKKGQSGNPKGRPKGSKNKNPEKDFMNLFEKELARKVSIQDENGPQTITMEQAIVRSTVVKAAQGDFRTQKLVLEKSQAAREKRAEDEDDSLTINIHFQEPEEPD
tara:strand:- start:250 stop:639 length:390 start_codon:yes stop_codon:yes gene_type:complete